MSILELTRRVERVELEVESLKAVQARLPNRTDGPAIEAMIGLFAGEPLFEEAVEAGVAWRKEQNGICVETSNAPS